MEAGDQQAAVRVRDLRKRFQLAHPEAGRITARLIHPVRGAGRRTLTVLDGVSFDVRKGEVFGIIGSNGAGKTTLLRLITGIYEPDGGTIEVTGRVAPFLEMGIGFQADLTARQNVMINGVLLGVPRREVRQRMDEILAFADLEDFGDMQLKNFSSGMRARLAFSIILVAAADIIIMDEVLTVGDAVFQQRCLEAFDRLRKEGKSIILVSHRQLEEFCDRAMLLHGGRVAAIGSPAHVSARYRVLREAQRSGAEPEVEVTSVEPPPLREARKMRGAITKLSVSGPAGDGSPIEAGEPVRVGLLVEVEYRLRDPRLAIELTDRHGSTVLASRAEELGVDGPLLPGHSIALGGQIETPLPPGRYVLSCALVHSSEADRRSRVSPTANVTFDVEGPESRPMTVRDGPRLQFAPDPVTVPARAAR